MIDSLSVPVPSFHSLLILGGLFLVLVYLDSRLKITLKPLDQQAKDTLHSKSLLEIESLRAECLQLRATLEQQNIELKSELQYSTFRQIQTLLTNYPSVSKLVEIKPDLPAKNIVSLFASLDNLIESWDYETIGQVWEQVCYSPQLHQSDVSNMEVGELVYIRFVGYRKGDRILAPAKVSRTLPAGIKN